MAKTIKKTLKIFIFITLAFITFMIGYIGFLYIFSDVKFDKTKITDSNLQVLIYDNQQRPIGNTFLKGNFVSLEQIPKHTQQCFIAIEDKLFYSHNGLNYKRIIGAMINNLKSFSFKEGASTISQQLIKNTHLSNDKTIKRKINEIKLTKQLEKNFSKDEILEYYLNIIYFGDNCYGIENASEHYFSKPVSKLSLDESAILAGIIKSPNRYHPIKQQKACLSRRNLILKELKNDNKINKEIYDLNISKPINLTLNYSFNKQNSYTTCAIKEAQKILKMPEKQLAIGQYKIFTNLNLEKQTALEQSIDKSINEQCAMISIQSKSGKIEAYAEKSNLSLINVKRQPASAIKPVLVYAPALNENIITPETQILDEKISINGYSPKNIGNKEHGYVSTTQALANSYNIPAVKILSYTGIQKSKKYLERQNIIFDDKDDNLALALGGMTYGMTLQQLTNSYQTLANNGNFIQSSFINYIVGPNGKIIYKNDYQENKIYRDDTSFLISKMLIESTKEGTAKKLGELKYEIASKTGTSAVSNNNIDTYNISYTSEDVVGCWIGNLDNSPTNIVGGGKPTQFVKNYFKKIYTSNIPSKFKQPSSVVKVEIDTIALNTKHIILKANNFLPERYRQIKLFSRFNMPKTNLDYSLTLEPVNIQAKVQNGVAKITYDSNSYYNYKLYKIENNKYKLISEQNGIDGKQTFNVSLENNYTQFFVKVYVKNYATGEILESDESNIIEIYNK